MFLAFLSGFGKNVVWHFLKACLLRAYTFRLFSACLAFIDGIWHWHVLSCDVAYLVHLNMERQIDFLWAL